MYRYSAPTTSLWSTQGGPIFNPPVLLMTRQMPVVSSSVTMSSPHLVSGVAMDFPFVLLSSYVEFSLLSVLFSDVFLCGVACGMDFFCGNYMLSCY